MSPRRRNSGGGVNTKPEPVLGAMRAESDQKMLSRAFVRTADFEALAGGPDHNFVIGRRGAGKSALYLELSKEFAARKELLVSFVPEESTVKGLVALLREKLGGEPKYSSVRSLMRVVWRASLLVAAAKVIGARHATFDSSVAAAAAEWRRPDVLASALAIVEALPSGVDPDSLVYKAASATACDTLSELVQADLDTLGARAFILIDKLDEGWRPHDIEAGIVGGLCAAVIDLRDKHTNVHGLIFLRDNVFRLLEEIDDDFSRNIAGDNLRLRWDAETLLDLVARRLQAATGVNETSALKIWNRFAKNGLSGAEGFQFCLQRTLFRPRDILELLNSARHLALTRRREVLIDGDISDAAHDIAKSRLSDLTKEYEEVFPGLSSYVQAFSGRPAVDSLKNVIDLLDSSRARLSPQAQRSFIKVRNNASSVVLSLFSVGFLGFELTGSGFQFCHDGADGASIITSPDTKVAVHPCYSRALDIEGANAAQFDVLLAVNDEYEDQKPDKGEVGALFRAGANTLLSQITQLKMGDEESSAFETWVFDVLRLLFTGELSNFEQKPNGAAPKRRDIVASNEAKSGVWRRLLVQQGAGQVFFEVKNFQELDPNAYHQAASYAAGPYGKLAFLVYRSLRASLNDNERSWVQQAWSDGYLLILVPVSVLTQCLRKQLTKDRADYTVEHFGRWIDTHQRKYVNPRAGNKS